MEPAGAVLAEDMRRSLRRIGVVSNSAGAALTFVFLSFLGPFPDRDDVGLVLAVNGAAFAAYMACALVVGTRWGERIGRPVQQWLRAERPPDERERRAVLRQPLAGARLSITLWALAAVVFGGVNAAFATAIAVTVAVTVTLGGVTTVALEYLLSERALRPVTALALAGEVGDGARGLGVRVRLGLAWALGTGIPLLGVVAIGIASVAGAELDTGEAVPAILFLAAVGLGVGLLLTQVAARSVADPLTAVRSALARVERGDFDVHVPVDDGSEIGFLEAGFNRMAEGLRERERLRTAFGAFVDPGLAERVLRDGTDLAGEEVEVSILFLDVRGFTSYAEEADARDVVARLNDLYDGVVPIVIRHGGHANKFIGDGLLAVFGAPERHPDHADRAVAAALEIAALVAGRYRGELRVGLGVNSGRVMAGTVGGGGRLDFTVIGDAVNTAARVESATRETGDDLLVTEATRSRLDRDHGAWERRPELPLKGKSQTVRLYAPGA